MKHITNGSKPSPWEVKWRLYGDAGIMMRKKSAMLNNFFKKRIK
jgi:hypothetical protein